MSSPTTRPHAVREIGSSRIPFAGAIRTGDFVFVSGLLPDELGNGESSLSGLPPGLVQARSIWTQANAILGEAGTDLGAIVRCDQYFQDWRAVPFFHQARREACGDYIAPSTSILQPALPRPGALVTADMIVAAPGKPKPEVIFPEGLDIPATSAFVPVVKSGPFVFVAGFLAASGPGDLDGIAASARVPEGHLWKGNRIQLETRYLIREKLLPALKGAKLGLEDVIKANVFLRDIEDVPAFNVVWDEAFGGAPPATCILPTSKPGFAIEDARIEINLVASTQKDLERFSGGRSEFTTCHGHPVAIRSGNFLIFSGMIAADRDGLAATARIAPRDHYFSSAIEAQMEFLIDCLEETCAKAGANLRNVARILQAHCDLDDLLPALKVWQRRLPGVPLPLSAIGVPAPLVVPSCKVQLDIWVYAPRS
ncbi:MAG: Rid family hydrolase [Pseudorhodoplanes sp.]